MRRDYFDDQDRLIRRDDDVAGTVTTWAADGTPSVRDYTPEEVAEAEARAGQQQPDRSQAIAQGIAAVRAELGRLEQALSGIDGRQIPARVPQMLRQARALLVAAGTGLRRLR